MPSSFGAPWSVALAVTVLTAGCSAVPAPTLAPSTQIPTSHSDHPLVALVQAAEVRLAAGERHLTQGQPAQALVELDRARALLSEASDGERVDPRWRQYIAGLVVRIDRREAQVGVGQAGRRLGPSRQDPAALDQLLTFASPEPAGPTAPLARADAARPLDAGSVAIPIPLNSPVSTFLRLFQGPMRARLADGLERAALYLPMIRDTFSADGLPLDLAWLPLVESGYKPTAVSRVRARGMWQFMAATATEHGLRRDRFVDERSDPEKSTRAAGRYLKTLYQMFDGDWHLALAAYNAGPGRVQRALRRSGASDFWALSARPGWIPRETRRFVPMVLAAIAIARDPTRFGFAAPAGDPMAFDRIEVPGPVDLQRIAAWTGATVDQIRRLNPELRRSMTPATATSYSLRVPSGTGPTLDGRLAALAALERTAPSWYAVEPGDSLSRIARRLRVRQAELAGANQLDPQALLHPGQILVVPRPLTVARGEPQPRGRSEVARVLPATRSLGGVTMPTHEGGESDQARHVYLVRAGDTLYRIARVFATSVAAIKEWNGLLTDLINVGDRLTLYPTRGALVTPR